MSDSNLTAEEKRQLTNARQTAVRNAWKNEKGLVAKGQGTRDWSRKEQQELIKRGAVKGYEGHHMKSVSKYPKYAGDPRNIQFLNEKEHLKAHQGDYHSPTNGYYNPKTGRMHKFRGDELKPVPKVSLANNTNQKNSITNGSAKTGQEKSAEFRNSLKKTESTKRKSSSANVKSNGNKR